MARFARAIDPGSRALDGADADLDEETRGLVTLTDRLRTGDFNGAPSPEFRDRLRSQLVALAETMPTGTPTTVARHGAGRPDRPGARRPTGRPAPRPRLALLAGALSALVAVSGLTVVVSGRALPGDTLYSLKRTTEHVELALAHGPQAKAQRHLDFAQSRARELADLVRRRGESPAPRSADPGADTPADRPVVTTLSDMDRQTRDGVRALTEFAVSTVADSPLADLASWAADQRAILEPVLERLHGDAGRRAGRSATLLDRIRDRVAALRSQLTCTCMDRTHGDDLGPLPCWPCNPQSTPRPPAGSPPVPQTGGTGPGSTNSGSAPTAAPPAPTTSTDGTPGTQTPLPQTTSPPTNDPSLLPPVTGGPTDGGGLLPPILPTGVLPPLLPGLLPGLLGG
ncbi:MAG TPA: DUF5667 domain-containing protein [Mycobacteriales bacterium]|nr:DUF5667 domain-containing protein [Mycobacteriales bacterium]